METCKRQAMSFAAAESVVCDFCKAHRSAANLLFRVYPGLWDRLVYEILAYGQNRRWTHFKRVCWFLGDQIARESSPEFSGQALWVYDKVVSDPDVKAMFDRMVGRLKTESYKRVHTSTKK
jgi:hypothetical protein